MVTDYISIVWGVFFIIFFFLGYSQWILRKVSPPKLEEWKVHKEELPNGVTMQVITAGVDIAEVANNFNKLANDYNKQISEKHKKQIEQHKWQAIGYFVASATALFSVFASAF